MKDIVVSAIITTFNRDLLTLKRAIDSVRSQTFKEIEIIVVNDNNMNSPLSSDINKLSKLYDNVLVVNNKTNKGACYSRNHGIKMSHGQYVAFLDDDDEWLPTKIEEQLKCFSSDDVVMVYCDNYVVYNNSKKRILFKRKPYYEKLPIRLMKENCIGSTSFPLIKKQALLDIGCFDENMPSLQDLDVWIKISRVGRCVLCDKPLAVFYVYSGERISNNPTKGIEGRNKLIERNWDFYSKHKMVLAYRLITLAPFYSKNGEYRRAFSTLFKGFLYNPFDIKNNTKELLHVLKYAFKKQKRGKEK